MAQGPWCPRWPAGRQSPGGARAVSPHWLTGRQTPSGARAVSPRTEALRVTDRQSPGGSRAAVSPHWRTGRQSPVGSRAVARAHGPSVPGWHTGCQSPLAPGARAVSPLGSGSRAVSYRVAHGPSVPHWRTGRSSSSGSRVVTVSPSRSLGGARADGPWPGVRIVGASRRSPYSARARPSRRSGCRQSNATGGSNCRALAPGWQRIVSDPCRQSSLPSRPSESAIKRNPRYCRLSHCRCAAPRDPLPTQARASD